MQLDVQLDAPAPAAPVPATGQSSYLQTFDRVFGRMVEIPAAILVVLEIVVLLSGVVSRYALHRPLVWSDELASILFLWLAMLGTVVAFRRGEHMRMTAFVGMATPRARAFMDTLAIVAGLVFVGVLLEPAFEFAIEESWVYTPALDLPNTWRAAALPVGFALMLVTAVLRLVQESDWRLTGAALALGAGLAAGLAGLSPLLSSIGNLNLLVFFLLGVGALVFSGVPIAFAFGLSTYAYLMSTTYAPAMVVVGRMDEGMSHLILLAVPLFIFLGLLIEMTGMARAMVGFLASLLGHVRGGLHYVLVGAMYLVSGISGSKAADMAAVAPVLFPEMKARGAKEGDLVALLSATGAQTETIPPSIVLITIGSVSGVSITALFTGGLLPAVVLGATLCALVWWRYRGEDMSHVVRPGRKAILKALVVAVPALALPFVIRAAVIEGVATATEVSTIGIVYAVLAGLLVYRQFDWRRLMPMLVTTATLSGAILLIIGAAHGLGADAVRLLAGARRRDEGTARRRARLPRGLRPRLHRAGLGAGGNPGDRPVRPADVSHRPGRGGARGALRHGRGSRDGNRPVRPALRRRLLRGLRHQPHPSGCRHAADHRLRRGAAGRADRDHPGALVLDRLPLKAGAASG